MQADGGLTLLTAESGGYPLILDLVGDVVQRFANLAPGLPESFLNAAGSLISHPFVLQLLVVCNVSPRLFGTALHLFSLSLELVAIHAVPPGKMTFNIRCVTHKNRTTWQLMAQGL